MNFALGFYKCIVTHCFCLLLCFSFFFLINRECHFFFVFLSVFAGKESLFPRARYHHRHQRRQQVDQRRRSPRRGQPNKQKKSAIRSVLTHEPVWSHTTTQTCSLKHQSLYRSLQRLKSSHRSAVATECFKYFTFHDFLKHSHVMTWPCWGIVVSLSLCQTSIVQRLINFFFRWMGYLAEGKVLANKISKKYIFFSSDLLL